MKVAEVDALGDVSADGRFLTYVDWSTGDLALRDLATGEDRRLTNKGTWEESSAWAEYSLIAPDSSSVVYAWRRGDDVYDLRLVGLDGSGARVLVAGDGLEYIAPRDWSRDGRQILAWQTRPNGDRDILLVSVSEGRSKIVKTLHATDPGKMQLSPDGSFLGYDVLIDARTGEHDVHLLAVASGREAPLATSGADERILGWSLDGGSILFSKESESRRSLWRIAVEDGRPSAEAEVILADMEQELVESLGFTQEGSWYYGVMEWVADLYLATLDIGSETLESPQKVATRLAVSSSADFSPDGRYLAWIQGGGEEHHVRTLVMRDVESGSELRWPVALNDRHGHHPRWAANGESLMMDSRDSEGRPAAFEITVQTGAVRKVARLESTCSDGCVAWQAGNRRDHDSLWATDGRSLELRSAGSGLREQLYRASDDQEISRLSLSPDGRLLAFVLVDSSTVSTRLGLVPSAGGPLRELLQIEGIETRYSTGGTRIAWSRDGRYLLLARTSGETQTPISVWYVPLDGGAPSQLSHSLPERSLYGLSLHPNGRTVALSLGQPGRYEVWKLDSAWLLNDLDESVVGRSSPK